MKIQKNSQISIGSIVSLKSQPEIQLEVIRFLRITHLAYCKHVHSENGEISYTYVNMKMIQPVQTQKKNIKIARAL
jgi:hypothetical protein